jgi:hypothetical protein
VIVANLEYIGRTEKIAANGNVKGALEGKRRNLILDILRWQSLKQELK